ncbi:MAG: hypothetical protein ACTSRS_21115 [Candidatus Helarchaeota archaeon]
MKMIDDPRQNIAIVQKFYKEREYQYNFNPMETLEKGEEYTRLFLDAILGDDYEFSFKLTTFEDKPVAGIPVWLYVGFVPKSKTKFLNERAIIEGTSLHPYYESFGTDDLSFVGPGEGPNKMFGKPLLYDLEYQYDGFNKHGPYIWTYQITDVHGEVSFNVSLDKDFLIDFFKIFGTIEGIKSIEDIYLYVRAFVARDDWSGMAISSPNQYLCSNEGDVFDGTKTPSNYDAKRLALMDNTYAEGILGLHKKDIALGLNDYYSYKLPGDEENGNYMPLRMYLYLSKANVIPTGTIPTRESLMQLHTSSELEATGEDVLNGDLAFYAAIEFVSPSGDTVESLFKQVNKSYDGGLIVIDNETMKSIVSKLGPGISSIRVQIMESEYYKASPIVVVPLQVTPENWIKFGKKNTNDDMIDPFISASGIVGYGKESAIFESNYPHLIGTFWIDPYFNESGSELSLQDSILIDLKCTAHEDDGTENTFPIGTDMYLYSGNQDGLALYDIPLGPEGEFLMGINCDLNLSISIASNEKSIHDQERDIKMYLLDLRLESSPSSSMPNTTWSIYDDLFTSDKIDVVTENEAISSSTGVIYCGGESNGQIFGQKLSLLFTNDTREYGFDSNDALLSLLSLVDVKPIKVTGFKEREEIELEEDVNWIAPYYPSSDLRNSSIIRIIGDDVLDENSELIITYQFKFDFGDKNYGVITLGSSNDINSTSIEFRLPEGFLPESNASRTSMFTSFLDSFSGDGSKDSFTLRYGIQGATDWSDNLFRIYNEQELMDNFGNFIKSVTNGHPILTFENIPPAGSKINVSYGIRSQYYISYGFQKLDSPFSTSVRLIYNDNDGPSMINQNNEGLKSADLEEPSLYIGFDRFEPSVTLTMQEIPLLYEPEINFTFYLDDVLLDLIKSSKNHDNNLTIKFKVITSDGNCEFYPDPIKIQLNYTELAPDIVNGIYVIQHSIYLQSIYNLMGLDEVDLEIKVSQEGNKSDFIPYLLLEQFNLLTDDYIIELYDRMPRKSDGSLDVEAVFNTGHYYQIFSKPFIDTQNERSPFDLMENSQVTVSLKDMPNTTLVSVDKINGEFELNKLGDKDVINVNSTNFYNLPNIAMFIDAYDMQEPIYQEGYVDLYYGSGTSINGEKIHHEEIMMAPDDKFTKDYSSKINDHHPYSWKEVFDFSEQFLTTYPITVEGDVFYHQIFDLDVDVNDSATINSLFPHNKKRIYFGLQLQEDLEVSSIRSVGKPYSYALSVQGFSIGKYKDEYCRIENVYSGEFQPSKNEENLVIGKDYDLAKDENGTAYILFYKPISELSAHADEQNKIMVDFWASTEFVRGRDFEIRENPNDPFISQIVWDFSFTNLDSFNLHPDFNDEASFTITFGALEWDQFNQEYVKECEDVFTFRPTEYYNISIFYDKISSTKKFSIKYIVPEDQYLDDSILFSSIFVLAQKGDDEDSITTFEISNDDADMIVQESPNSCNYTINYDILRNKLKELHGQDYDLVKYSFIYILARYNSSTLKYEMERVPFNYEYLGDDHDAYHIALTINGNFIAYSNETLFDDYVNKIEDGYIYLNEHNKTDSGYIAPQSEIKLVYKYKLQPGLLDRKHFIVAIYPWSNIFENSLDYLSDSPVIYREKYRKLSGGSIIAPFEHSLSIDEKYSLYLAYRLNRRNYMEEKFQFDHAKKEFEFTYLKHGLENFVSVIADDDDIGLTVYYYDEEGRFQILDDSHYDIDLNDHKIILKDDGNVIVTPNEISEFYVSFIPSTPDRELSDYEFSYDPRYNITKTIKLSHWTIEGTNSTVPLPNLDAYHYIVENKTSSKLITCRASQVVVLLENNTELVIDLAGELLDFDPGTLNALHQGEFNKIHVEVKSSNLESLSELRIELHDENGLMEDFAQVVTREELKMLDNEIIISLPMTTNSLKLIKLIPTFRTDDIYSLDNTKGIMRIDTIEWDEDRVSAYPDGHEYMKVELKHELKVDGNGQNFALLFNDALEHLKTLEDMPINYSIESDGTSYLLIPRKYLDPKTNDTANFEDGDNFAIKYYSPIKRYLLSTFGKMFLEYKGHDHDSHPDLPKAEMLLVNANSSSSHDDFLSDYYLQVPLEVTPFETEYNNRFKTIKIDLNVTALFNSTGTSELFFSHLLFSVPDPSYELTLSDVILIRESDNSSIEYNHAKERVWQYTEVEIFKSSANPSQDSYALKLEKEPLFYPDEEWLSLVRVSDEDGNYYSVGTSGNDHQLHYNSTTKCLTWNPSFVQVYNNFGIEEEDPLIIKPNTTLYFEYFTNTSWKAPIRIEDDNVNLESIIVSYDGRFLLRPEFHDWYQDKHGVINTYEYIAYSFTDHDDYEVIQYLVDSFTIHANVSEYTRKIDVGSYSLDEDFDNLSLYKVVGISPTLASINMLNNSNFDITFNLTSGTIKIIDLNLSDGSLNEFERISVFLNYSFGPISSFTEIYLLDGFNNTFLTDIRDTFYDTIGIDYNYNQNFGEIIFGEISSEITSNYTCFKSIDYNRNPDISVNYSLNGYGSELFDNFEIYEDQSSVVLIADMDMDGSPEYKHLIDVDKDGKFDIVRYGTENPENHGEIIWYLTIQEFESEEVKHDRYLEEEMRTKWFDLDDRTFAYYDFNVLKLIGAVLCFPLLNLFLLNMLMPEVDYWAQKSVQREVITEQDVKSVFYSIISDEDRDGVIDLQTNFERTTVNINYTITEYKKTSLAAKFQNPLTWLLDYTVQSFEALLTGKKTDPVFNDALTVEMIESNNFSSCNPVVKANTGFLKATYRSFTENVTMQYTDSFARSQITVINYDEDGEPWEQRVYSDEFDTGEVDEVEKYFENAMRENSVVQVDDGMSLEVTFDPEFPISNPSNVSWSCKTWGQDNMPLKYDNLEVYHDNGFYSTNAFERKIIIRIPNRYSLFHDYQKISRDSVKDGGWVEFETEGILIAPQDGMVYYTSDRDSFDDGTAKTRGYYFFVDSDGNGYFETVYVLSPIRSRKNGKVDVFDVISIGLNQDGIHDLVPYEDITVSKDPVTDYGELASEKKKFGLDWVYNFNDLKREPTLGIEDEPSHDENSRVKDLIFEAYKLVDESEQNPKFSELFHELRHEEYSRAWDQYKKQLIGDIAEQVFMSVTASVLSAAVEAIVTGSTLGLGSAAGKALGALTYFTVYTLMTKFFMDIKMKRSSALMASQSFYPPSVKSAEPVNLNEKSVGDRILGDSMGAALLGHPGGYYTTVKGMANGKIYQAQLLVTPPNLGRLMNSFNGFFKLLAENLLNMGESDPDSFAALDFDDANLDYFMLTSELPSYNLRKFHEINLNDPLGIISEHAKNTLGYLENEIKTSSNHALNGIRPTWTLTPSGNILEYNFVDKYSQAKVLPLETLYQPVVISKERFDQLNPEPLELVVRMSIDGLEASSGISSSDLNDVERKIYYGKIPLSDEAFDYPIESVEVDVIETTHESVPQVVYTEAGWFYMDEIVEKETILAKGIELNESDYYLDTGNLYLCEPLFKLASKSFPELIKISEEHSSVPVGAFSPELSFMVRIRFNTVVKNDSLHSNRLALAQATSFVLLDYFNQYVYAETTANMIAEIAYTETVTFWSTLISAPLVFLGSWAVSGLKGVFSQAGAKVAQAALSKSASGTVSRGMLKLLSFARIGLSMALSPMKEVFEEIVIDGFIEAIIQNGVAMLGGTDELGFWLSSLGTSGRELGGSLKEISDLGSEQHDKMDLLEQKAVNDFNPERSALDSREDVKSKISNERLVQEAIELEKEELKKLLFSGVLKGAMLLLPSAFIGSFDLLALLIDPTFNLFKKSCSIFIAKVHSKRIGKEISSIDKSFYSNLRKQLKKPSNIEWEDLNGLLKGENINENSEPPVLIAFPEIGQDIYQARKTKLREILWKTGFPEEMLMAEEILGDSIQGIAFVDDVHIEESIRDRETFPEDLKLKMRLYFGDKYEGLLYYLNDEEIKYIYSYLYSSEDSPLRKSGFKYSTIPYGTATIEDVVEFLKGKKYCGIEIINELGNGISMEILNIIFGKIERNEQLSLFEGLIFQSGAYLMGGIYKEAKYNEFRELFDAINIHKWRSDSELIALNKDFHRQLKSKSIDLFMDLYISFNDFIGNVIGIKPIQHNMRRLKIDISGQKSQILAGDMRCLSKKKIESLIQNLDIIFNRYYPEPDFSVIKSKEKLDNKFMKYLDYVKYVNRRKSTKIYYDSKLKDSIYPRSALIENIRYYFPKKYGIPLSDEMLSKYIFGNEKTLNEFLSEREHKKKPGVPEISKRPQHYKLFLIDFLVQELKKEDFKEDNIEIATSYLRELKDNIKDMVRLFFFLNPYTPEYIDFSLFLDDENIINKEKTVEFIISHYDLIRNVLFALWKEKGEIISFSKIKTNYKKFYPIFTSFNLKKFFYSSILEIIKDEISKFKDSKYKSLALNSINKYLEFEIHNKRSIVGIAFHHIFEYTFADYLSRNNIEVFYEPLVNFPESRVRADLSIIRNDNFIRRIEKKQDLIIFSNKINEILIDFTMSTDWTTIERKIQKGYQSDDRYLFIVIISFGKSIKNKIEQLNENINNLDISNVKVISISDFCKFLNYNEINLDKLINNVKEYFISIALEESRFFELIKKSNNYYKLLEESRWGNQYYQEFKNDNLK